MISKAFYMMDSCLFFQNANISPPESTNYSKPVSSLGERHRPDLMQTQHTHESLNDSRISDGSPSSQCAKCYLTDSSGTTDKAGREACSP